MGIKGINNNSSGIGPLENRKREESQKSSKGKEQADNVQLSAKARKLYEMKKAERLEEIRRQIDDKYFDEPEVTEKVADAIIKALKNPK